MQMNRFFPVGGFPVKSKTSGHRGTVNGCAGDTEPERGFDVDNEYSDSSAFHLTQRTTYTALVQLMLGYLCAKRGCRRADLGMPVLESLHLNWREMVPFAKDIRLEVTETKSTTENGFERMELAFRIGNEHGSGTLVGRVPQA